MAQLVAPGPLVGVDLDATHLERARATARERGVANAEYLDSFGKSVARMFTEGRWGGATPSKG